MILVTGFNGQLGYDVVKELKKRDAECLGIGRKEVDITDRIAVDKYIKDLKPDCIIHCAAYTAVDKAEDDREMCEKVNVVGTENIARASKEINAKMIYISTDYVFDGLGNEPFEIDGKINPHCVYGKTKYEGELIVKKYLEKYFIVRISWVFGKNGNNFVKTMLRLGKEKKSINVVCDQIGSPTYTVDLSKVLCDMTISEKYGTYHATNEGYCSWADFASEIMKKSGYDCKINYVLTRDYQLVKATRPLNSKMSKKSLIQNGFNLMPTWENALERYLDEIV